MHGLSLPLVPALEAIMLLSNLPTKLLVRGYLCIYMDLPLITCDIICVIPIWKWTTQLSPYRFGGKYIHTRGIDHRTYQI